VVRGGVSARLENDKETKRSTHKLVPVYRELLAQICREVPSLPDPRTLSLAEIRFFYESMRAELCVRTRG